MTRRKRPTEGMDLALILAAARRKASDHGFSPRDWVMACLSEAINVMAYQGIDRDTMISVFANLIDKWLRDHPRGHPDGQSGVGHA